MNCEQYQENLVAYLRHELPQKKKEQMTAHYTICARCKEETRKTRSALQVAAVASGTPVSDIVSTYIVEALKRDAADLHFETRGGDLTVRCRVDGVLIDLNKILEDMDIKQPEEIAFQEGISMMFGKAVLTRLKAMSGVDAAESTIPQEGRIPVRHDEKDYNLSASFMPTADGEDAVFRIISKTAPLSLDIIGLSDEVRERVEHLTGQHMGLILVSGPAGSGKTTTLITLAQHLASPYKKVVTVEDPVYPRMENVTQIEVAEHKGMTTSAILSRVIRLDPDIVAVHAMSDQDVAAKCASIVLNGSIVTAGFYANDAAAAVSGFADLFGDRDLAASLVIGATNQRLVRRICSGCREEYIPSSQALQSLHLEPSSMKFVHGAGCEKCKNTGYLGRTTVMEVLEMTQELMDLLLVGSDPAMFRTRAKAATTPTLLEDARRKVLSGITTPEEACRVIPLPR